MENKTKGSGLIFAVVLLFVILGMVITLSSITVLETKMSQKTKSSIGAFYNSESGVEWALNQIATKDGTARISTIPSCPFTGCSVLFLGADGNVLNPAIASNTIDKVKAVRSVGTQGGETQRAIEAAVASGGGGCYVSYKTGCSDSPVTSGCCVTGFTNKGSVGAAGFCVCDGGTVISSWFYRPPGADCPCGDNRPNRDAFLCCQ